MRLQLLVDEAFKNGLILLEDSTNLKSLISAEYKEEHKEGYRQQKSVSFY
jgi:dTDP-4-dehydrorhamnose 3,5-epimerase-like enzyme